MSIERELEEAKQLYFQRTGKRATRFYLGREQFQELKTLALSTQNSIRAYFDLEGEKRPEVLGLPVFIVAEDYHLNAA